MTIVNVILAMRINALYKANQGCGVLLGSLVIGKLHLRETFQLSELVFQESFWFVFRLHVRHSLLYISRCHRWIFQFAPSWLCALQAKS